MNTIFDEGSKDPAEGLHILPRVFPMQGDKVLEDFQNTFSKEFTPISVRTDPPFLNILKVLAPKHPVANELLAKGGVTRETAQSFYQMLSDVEIHNSEFTTQDILKAIFKELITDPIQASSAHSLFVTYVMFHGYNVIDYRVVQRFIERINANGGLLPGGFDEMKEIVEGISKAEPVIQEIYTPSTKDPKLEELINKTKASRVDFSNDEESDSLVKPEFQPPMIAAGAAGGRRTKRRGRRGQKKQKTRRLTKKERNS